MAWALGGGLLASAVLGGGTYAVVKGLQRQAAAAVSAPAYVPPCAQSGSVPGVGNALTLALQKHDRAAWLATADAPSAAAAMGQWWDNVDAIGFDTGGVQTRQFYPVDDGKTLLATVGWHNPFDGRHEHGAQTAPDAPGTGYRLTTAWKRVGGTCRQTITQWSGLDDAPWDAPVALGVVRTAHAEVIYTPGHAADGRADAPLAERAATWQLGFFAAAGQPVDESGYLVFLAPDDAAAKGWFKGRTAERGGWPDDPQLLAGYASPLQPPTVLGGNGTGIQELGAGGGRIVLTPTAAREPELARTATLVHEFTHATFQDEVTFLVQPPKAQDRTAAIWEGSARYVEAIFTANPKGYTGDPTAVLRASLAPRKATFTGKVPTAAQIYGAAADGEYFYDVSATTFLYVERTHGGRRFAVLTIRRALSIMGDPLNGILVSDSGGTQTFASSAVEQPKWAAWVRAHLS